MRSENSRFEISDAAYSGGLLAISSFHFPIFNPGVPQSAITRGGEAPDVVLAFAEACYYVRSPRREMVTEVRERVENAASGVALGTGTTVDW